MKYQMVSKYVETLRDLKFKDPQGPSAAMARQIIEIFDRKGPAALASWAHSVRHDGHRLSNGAFTQVVTICALSNADQYGSIAPFIRRDITARADAILASHGIK